MPHAVTHVLFALIIADFIRDHIVKSKEKFPIHYVLIAGIAGLLPDIDVAAYYVLYFFGFSFNSVHRAFTHTLLLPLLFILLAIITIKVREKELGRHHMKLSIIFLMIALGSFIHLLLDATLSGVIKLFYPLSSYALGLNLVSLTPFSDSILPALDAFLLVFWLFHEESTHRISDFW